MAEYTFCLNARQGPRRRTAKSGLGDYRRVGLRSRNLKGWWV